MNLRSMNTVTTPPSTPPDTPTKVGSRVNGSESFEGNPLDGPATRGELEKLPQKELQRLYGLDELPNYQWDDDELALVKDGVPGQDFTGGLTGLDEVFGLQRDAANKIVDDCIHAFYQAGGKIDMSVPVMRPFIQSALTRVIAKWRIVINLPEEVVCVGDKPVGFESGLARLLSPAFRHRMKFQRRGKIITEHYVGNEPGGGEDGQPSALRSSSIVPLEQKLRDFAIADSHTVKASTKSPKKRKTATSAAPASSFLHIGSEPSFILPQMPALRPLPHSALGGICLVMNLVETSDNSDCNEEFPDLVQELHLQPIWIGPTVLDICRQGIPEQLTLVGIEDEICEARLFGYLNLQGHLNAVQNGALIVDSGKAFRGFVLDWTTTLLRAVINDHLDQGLSNVRLRARTTVT